MVVVLVVAERRSYQLTIHAELTTELLSKVAKKNNRDLQEILPCIDKTCIVAMSETITFSQYQLIKSVAQQLYIYIRSPVNNIHAV